MKQKRIKDKPIDGFIVEVSDGYWLSRSGGVTPIQIQARVFATEAEAELARERFMNNGD